MEYDELEIVKDNSVRRFNAALNPSSTSRRFDIQ